MPVIPWIIAALIRRGVPSEAAKPLAYASLAIGGAVAFMALIWGMQARQAANLSTSARLDSERASAANSAAGAAVNAVAQRGAQEADIHERVSNAQNAVRSAGDPAAADAAGRDGLCALTAHFCADSAMQQSRTH
jgi:hypothetical protein